MTIINQITKNILSENILSNFKWYRKKQGGFWIYSHKFGWQQQKNQHAIKLTLKTYASHPILYDYGKDIEDYRSIK